jgi:chromosome segregation ATPase
VAINQQKDLGLNKYTETQARLNDLNGQIKETDKRIAEIEKQLAGMQPRISTQSRILPNQQSVERFSTMLVELRNRRIQLLTKFQPEDRLVKEVDEQIRTTTEALAKASQTTYSEAGFGFESAAANARKPS